MGGVPILAETAVLILLEFSTGKVMRVPVDNITALRQTKDYCQVMFVESGASVASSVNAQATCSEIINSMK